MTVTPPANLSYGTIEARFAIDVVDSEDADTHPDLVPPTGYVTFTSSVAKILNPTSVPDELVILRSPIFGVIDEQGYLCTPNLKLKSPQYPRGVPAYRGVELIATDDPDLNPLHSTYTVTYSLKNSVGDRIEGVESHALTVPGGTVQDLAKIIPPDAADAIGIPQANASAARAEAAALSADQRAAVAEQAAVIASGALLDSAQFVADELVDAESPARQVLDPLVNAKNEAAVKALAFTGNVSPDDSSILLLSYLDVAGTVFYPATYPTSYPERDPDAAVQKTVKAALLGTDGKIPDRLGGGGGSISPVRTALTIATGFIVPSWGSTPSRMTIGPDIHLAGNIGRGAADILANAILCTGGVFTPGRKATATTDTGTVLVRTTNTTIEVDQILSGASPQWVTLDGVIV